MNGSQTKFESWFIEHYAKHGWSTNGILFMLSKKADGSYAVEETERQYKYWQIKELYPTEYP